MIITKAMEQLDDEPFAVLPLELRSIIYCLCQKEDLKNLALCNKWICEDVLPLLWKKVCLKWTTVMKFTPQKRTSSMRLISHLTMGRMFHRMRTYRKLNTSVMGLRFSSNVATMTN